MTKALGSVLLIVDDWEALERYEERLGPLSAQIETCPLAKEAHRLSAEKEWDWVLLDLTSEDMTLREACSFRAATNASKWLLVGEKLELAQLRSKGLLRALDQEISRPFEWQSLLTKMTDSSLGGEFGLG